MTQYSQSYKIAKEIARRTEAPFDVVWPIIQEYIEACAEHLDSGEDLRIQGLGSFIWTRTPQNRYHNVNTRRIELAPAGRRLKWNPPHNLRGVRHGEVRSRVRQRQGEDR